MIGWFKVSREILDLAIWKNQIVVRIYIYLLSNAIFDDTIRQYGDIKVGKNQYLRSLRNISSDLEFIENNKVKNYSISTVKRSIELLKQLNLIDYQETSLGTLFTIYPVEFLSQNAAKTQAFQINGNNLNNGCKTATKRCSNNNNNYNNNRREYGLNNFNPKTKSETELPMININEPYYS